MKPTGDDDLNEGGITRPVTGSPESPQSLAATWMERSYSTYKSRISATGRLKLRGVAWDGAMISTSTATTIASIGLLSDQMMYGLKGATLLACLAVITLVSSLVTTNMAYGSRAKAMESNYKEIQRVSAMFEQLSRTSSATLEQVELLRDRYLRLIAESENHSTADWLRATDGSAHHSYITRFFDGAVTAAPAAFLLVPVATLVPFVIWLAQ
jgi:hypothetical protein